MAIGTPTSCGTFSTGVDASTFSFNTTAAVPSGAQVFLAFNWGNNPARTVSSAAVGGVTVTADKSVAGVDGTFTYGWALYSAPAPSGISSASSASVTFSSTTSFINMAVFYVTGLATSSVVDGTPVSVFRAGGTNSSPWTSGSQTTTNADDLLVGVSFADHSASGFASVPSGGFTELFDFQDASSGLVLVVEYQIVAATGSYAATGNWQASGVNSNPDFGDGSLMVAYKADAGGGGSTAAGTGLRRFPLGV